MSNLYFDLRGKLYSVPPDDEKSLEELRQLGAKQLDEREGNVRRLVNEYDDSTVAPFLYGVGKGLTFNVLPSALQGVGLLEEGEAEAIERAAPGTVLAGEIAGAVAPVIGTFGAAAPATATRLGAKTLGAAFKEVGELAAKDLSATGLAKAGVRGTVSAAATPARVVSEQALRAGQKLADVIPGETLISRAARTVTPGATAGAIEGALYSAGAGFNEELITNPDATIQEAMILGAKDMGDGFLWGSVLGGGLSAGLAGAAKTFQGAVSVAKSAYGAAFQKYGEGFTDRVARMIMTGDDESRDAFRRKLFDTLDPSNNFDLKEMQSRITQAENVSSSFKDTISEFKLERRIERLEQQRLRGEKTSLKRDIGKEQTAAATRAAEQTEIFRQQIDEANDLIALYQKENYEAQAKERGLKVLNAQQKAEAIEKQKRDLADATRRLNEAEKAAAQTAEVRVGEVAQELAQKEEALSGKRAELAEARVITNKSVAELRQIFDNRSRLLRDQIDAADEKIQNAQLSNRPEQAKRVQSDKDKAQKELRDLRQSHREEMIDLRYDEQSIRELNKENLEYLNSKYREVLSDPSQDKALMRKAEKRIFEAIDENERQLVSSTDELLAEINKREKAIISLDAEGEKQQRAFKSQAIKEQSELATETEKRKKSYQKELTRVATELNNPSASPETGVMISGTKLTPLARKQIDLFRKEIVSSQQVLDISANLFRRGEQAKSEFLRIFNEVSTTPEKELSAEALQVYENLNKKFEQLFGVNNSVVAEINALAKDFVPDSPDWSLKFYKQYLRATKLVQTTDKIISDAQKRNVSITDLMNFKDGMRNAVYDLSYSKGPVLSKQSGLRLFGDASSVAANARKLRSFTHTQQGKPKKVTSDADNLTEVSGAIVELIRNFGKTTTASDLRLLDQKLIAYKDALNLEADFANAVKDLETFSVLNQRNYDQAVGRFDSYFQRDLEPFSEEFIRQRQSPFAAARSNLKEIIEIREGAVEKIAELKKKYQLGTEEAIKQAELAKESKELISKSFDSLRKKSTDLLEQYKESRRLEKQLSDDELSDFVIQRLELQDEHAAAIAKAREKLQEANVTPGDEANILAKQIQEMNVDEQTLVAELKQQLQQEPEKYRNTILLLRAVRDETMRTLRAQESNLLAEAKTLRGKLKDTRAEARKPVTKEIAEIEAEISGIRARRKSIIDRYKSTGPSAERTRTEADLEFVRQLVARDKASARAQIDEITDSIVQSTEEKLKKDFDRIKEIDEEIFKSQQRNLEFNKNEAERLKSLSKEVDPDVRKILDYRKRDRFGSIANFFGLEALTNFGGAFLPMEVSAGIYIGSKLLDQPRDVLRITGGLLGLSSKMGEVIDTKAKAVVDRVTKPGTVTSINKAGEELRVSPLYQLVGLKQSYTNDPNQTMTQEEYNEASQEIRNKASDVDGMQAIMRKSVAPFGDIKKLQGPARAAPGKAFQYLNTLVLEQPSQGLFDYRAKVTPPQQRQAFKNALLVVRDPVNTFFNQLESNTLSPMTIQAMRAIYPDVTNQIIEATLNAFSASGEQIPYTTRLALSSGLSAGLDSSVQPANVQLFQLNFQNQGPGQQQGGQATVNAGALGQIPGAQPTGIDRVTNR